MSRPAIKVRAFESCTPAAVRLTLQAPSGLSCVHSYAIGDLGPRFVKDQFREKIGIEYLQHCRVQRDFSDCAALRYSLSSQLTVDLERRCMHPWKLSSNKRNHNWSFRGSVPDSSLFIRICRTTRGPYPTSTMLCSMTTKWNGPLSRRRLLLTVSRVCHPPPAETSLLPNDSTFCAP